MKLRYLVWIAWVSLWLVTACKATDGNIAPESPTTPPVETIPFPKGQPIGNQTSFTITPAGGEFVSTDKQIKVKIPAGAVSESTTITMQPVQNTDPAGLGKSVRLLPHTIQFKKPVTIQLSYASLLDSIPSINALSAAYQDEQGIWRFAQSRAINERTRTVTVATTHFSDWGIATAVRLLPFETTLSENEEQRFRLVQYVRINSYDDFAYELDDDALTPLVPATVKVIYEGQPLDPKYVKADSWELNTVDQGSELGHISSAPNSSECIYKAPLRISHPYQVGVSVAFNSSSKGKILFVATVNLVPGNAVIYRIGEGSWQSIQNVTVRKVNGLFKIQGTSSTTGVGIVLTWKGDKGNYSWNVENNNGISLIDPSPYLLYSSAYHDTKGNVVNSGGELIIDQLGNPSQLVKGRFTVKPSGLTTLKGEEIGPGIEGFFSLTRGPDM